jgi:glycosyltransferase involved in cell wall biosynthesis
LTHSLDLRTGGVAKAVCDLSDAFNTKKVENLIFDNPSSKQLNPLLGANLVIAHGLWQWPGRSAIRLKKKYDVSYIVFPHGMLDPWFKENYPLKHLKKQIYWLWKQSSIMKNASAVCFTTEEEMRLARKTFWPFDSKQIVTGLGVGVPPAGEVKQKALFKKKFTTIKGKKLLLYMGRIHPKKGLDLLLTSYVKQAKSEHVLIIAGPINDRCGYTEKLFRTYNSSRGVLWTGMLEGDLKWGALRSADAMILPSHQENYGMVVAEACSVGTPVLITNKVNLYREILQYDAGFVDNDNQDGVDNLIKKWISGKVQYKKLHAINCFKEKLHIYSTAEKIIDIANKR